MYFLESQAPTITASPNAKVFVAEGQNITLEWTYNVGGNSFRELEFVQTTDSIRVLDKFRTDPVFIVADYRGRVTAFINETNAKITFLNASRADSKTYRLTVENEDRDNPARNTVEMEVQCKYL